VKKSDCADFARSLFDGNDEQRILNLMRRGGKIKSAWR